MTVVIDGTTGISGVDGTASNPSYEGTDSNTGIFFPAADTIAFAQNGTESLRLNASGQVAVNAAGSASAPTITKADDLNTGIFFPAADTIAFAEGGAEVARFDSAGNFGLGLSPNTSQGRLQVVNFSIAGGAPATSGTTDANQLTTFGMGSTQLRFGAYASGAAWVQQSANSSYATNYDLVLQPNGGNVGIGTSSPTQRLDVSGNIISSQSITVGTGGLYQAGSIYSDANWGMLFRAKQASPGIADFRWSNASDTERMRIDASGNLAFNSGYGSVATAYGCRAWVNFNGTGTVAIRASGNVTSITDNGTGDYTVNFTTAMPDTSYTVVCSNGQDTPGTAALRTANPAQTTSVTTSGVRVISGFMGSGAANRTAEDCAVYNMAAFR